MAERLDEHSMALRAAREFQDGMVINLGNGIPSLASSFIPEGREVIFQAENGCLGFGRGAETDEEEDIHLTNASLGFVIPKPGMALFDSAESFSMIRGGHIDLCILGGLQVSEKGDLANWLVPGREPGGMGGAMDLTSSAKRFVVVMTHTTKEDKPKIVRECSYALTAVRCVSLIITDIAAIEVTPEGLVLTEYVPGWSAEEIRSLTEPELKVSPDLKEMTL